MVTLILAVAIAVFVSALCSLLEASLLSFTPSQIDELASSRPSVARLWQHFKVDLSRPIAAILIVNTTAATIGATVAGSNFESVFDSRWLPVCSIVFTLLILQFGEILPKTLGVRYNRALAPFVAQLLRVMIFVLRPVIYVVDLVNRPFQTFMSRGQTSATLAEISALAGLARLSKLIGTHQERIIRGASRLSELKVSDILIPVNQVTFISSSQTLNEAIVTAHFDPHTRFPICENDDPHRVHGYVNFKEIIYHARTNPADKSLAGITRPVHFASPEESAADLMRVFVDEHVHIAIVRGPDGTTLGLITLEDIIEELVGELEDEFDKLPRMCHELSSGTWMVGGGLPISELADRLGLELRDSEGTTSAWLVRRFGRVPKPNEVHQENGTKFTVRRTRRHKVFEVSIMTS